MDAVVTLKLSPQEFDLVREAVKVQQANEYLLSRNDGVAAKDKQEARKNSLLLHDILAKMGG